MEHQPFTGKPSGTRWNVAITEETDLGPAHAATAHPAKETLPRRIHESNADRLMTESICRRCNQSVGVQFEMSHNNFRFGMSYGTVGVSVA